MPMHATFHCSVAVIVNNSAFLPKSQRYWLMSHINKWATISIMCELLCIIILTRVHAWHDGVMVGSSAQDIILSRRLGFESVSRDSFLFEEPQVRADMVLPIPYIPIMALYKLSTTSCTFYSSCNRCQMKHAVSRACEFWCSIPPI